MLFEVRLLGRFSVRRGGEEIPPGEFGGRLVRTLVRVLVTRRGRFTPTDLLADALWGERLPADPAGNLKVLVNRARRALREPSLILTGSGGYSFADDERCVVDADQFVARVEAGRRLLAGGDPESALSEFLGALEGWGGEPLPEDAYEDWAQEYRARLERAHLEALEEGAAAALAVGQPEQAVALAEQAAAREPYREAAHTLLMRGLAAAGDTAAALAAYEALRRRLAEDLGLSPSADTAAVHARILGGESVAPPPRSHPPARAGLVVDGVRAFEPLTFVGRGRELDALLERASARSPCRAVVSGPAGVGKTRLLAEVVARSPGPALEGRAFPAERDEPWALARSLLREALNLDLAAAKVLPDRAAQALADVLPELEELRHVPLGEAAPESRRALALEGAIRLIQHAVPKGALVVVDDLQWADATSLAFLELALRRVRGLGAILAYRPDEMASEAPAAAFLAELMGAQEVLAVALGPLGEPEVAELVASEELRLAILEETDRSPLAVGEVLRALAARGDAGLGPCGRWRTRTAAAAALAREAARAGQLRVTQGRVARLPPRRQDLLALLALVRREVPARVLAEATAREQAQVLDDLDALARAGLVRLGDEGWAVAHDAVADAVAAGLGRPQRGRLHALLARALASHGGEPAEVARHLAEAGDADAAVEAFVRAGRRSLERFASEEAERLADEGLRLGPSGESKAALLEVRAEARARLGKSRAACEDLRAVLAATARGPRRALLLARLANLASSTEGYERAAELVELALTEAGGEPAARAQALAIGTIVDLNAGRPEQAEARAAEAGALFEQLGDTRGLACVLEARGLRRAVHGRLGEAAPPLDRAARLFRDSGDLLRAGAPRSNRGFVLVTMGRAEEGLADIDEALELERLLGHFKGEYTCLWARVQALIELGRTEEALGLAEAATATVRAVGNREGLSAWLLVLGMARRASSDPEGAEAALRECLHTSEGLPLFHAWAAARLASVLVAQGKLAAAEPLVATSLALGLPLTHHAARLARAELAIARGDPDAADLVTEALERAEAEDHLATAAELRTLLASLGQPRADAR